MSRYLATCPGCGASRVLFVARSGRCIDCADEDQLELDLAPERNVRPASANFQKPNSRRRPPKELAPCPYGGKKSYASRAKARASVRGRSPESGALHAYQCSRCRLWHLTSEPRRRAS